MGKQFGVPARGAVVSAVALGAALVMFAPMAANAAPVVSQSEGRLLIATLGGQSLDPVAALNGATAVDLDGSGPDTEDVPLDASVLSGLLGINVSPGINLFGDNGIIQLGAVGQYAQARDDGSSVAFSGTVSAANSLIGVGSVSSGSNLGTPGAGDSAVIAIGNPSTGLVSINATIGVLAASAQETAAGVQSGDYDLADLNLNVGGTVLYNLLNPVDLVLSGLISGVNSNAGTSIPDPIAGGKITISLDDLLAVAGVSSVNDLPANTDLLSYLPQAVVNKVTSVLNTTLTSLGSAISGLGLPGATLAVTLAAVQALVTPLLSGLTTAVLAPLGTALTALAQLVVNGQSTDADGSFTETALTVGVGTNGSVAQVKLANATVGPNAGIDGVPVVNSDSAMIAGGIGAAIAGGALVFALVRRRRNATSAA